MKTIIILSIILLPCFVQAQQVEFKGKKAVISLEDDKLTVSFNEKMTNDEVFTAFDHFRNVSSWRDLYIQTADGLYYRPMFAIFRKPNMYKVDGSKMIKI